MEASLPLFYSGDVEWMEGGLLPSELYQPYQQQRQQMMTDSFYFPLRPMPVAPPSYSSANRTLSMDRSLSNPRLQVRLKRLDFFGEKLVKDRILIWFCSVSEAEQQAESGAPPAAHGADGLLASAPGSIRLGQGSGANTGTGSVPQESRGGEGDVAEDRQGAGYHDRVSEPHYGATDEPFTGFSPDAGDAAATCSSHPLAAEEPREGTGMGLCKACGSPNSHVLLLSCSNLCEFQLREASLDALVDS